MEHQATLETIQLIVLRLERLLEQFSTSPARFNTYGIDIIFLCASLPSVSIELLSFVKVHIGSHFPTLDERYPWFRSTPYSLMAHRWLKIKNDVTANDIMTSHYSADPEYHEEDTYAGAMNELVKRYITALSLEGTMTYPSPDDYISLGMRFIKERYDSGALREPLKYAGKTQSVKNDDSNNFRVYMVTHLVFMTTDYSTRAPRSILTTDDRELLVIMLCKNSREKHGKILKFTPRFVMH